MTSNPLRPDAQGYWYDENHGNGLGRVGYHRSLTGSQPMRSHCRRIFIMEVVHQRTKRT